MRRIKLKDSSNIEAAYYDLKTTHLKIKFKSGACYGYYGVERQVITEWQKAESVGSYFYKNIRSNFVYDKITNIEEPSYLNYLESKSCINTKKLNNG